jgi:hypothetical protein
MVCSDVATLTGDVRWVVHGVARAFVPITMPVKAT